MLYAVVVIPISMAISLAIALGLNQKIRGLGFFRTAFYIPTVTATVAVATIWLWIYNPGSGLANGFLSLFGFAPSQWLSDPDTALPSLMVVGIWQGLGTKIIIYLAALQGVSRDLLESADAGRRQPVAAVRQRHLAGARPGAVLRPDHVDRRHLPGLRPGLRDDATAAPAPRPRCWCSTSTRTRSRTCDSAIASAETVIMMILIAVFIGLGRLLQKADVND